MKSWCWADQELRPAAPQGAPRLELDGLRLVALPDYTGPLQYLQCRGRIRSIVREVLPTVDSIIMRGGHQISQVVYSFLRGTGRPYGVEVVGDPYNSLARDATPSPLWTMLRRSICAQICSGCAATHMPRPMSRPKRCNVAIRRGPVCLRPIIPMSSSTRWLRPRIVSDARSVPTNRHRRVGHKIQGS